MFIVNNTFDRPRFPTRFSALATPPQGLPMHTALTLTFSEAVAVFTLRPPEGKPPTLDHALLDRLDDACAEVESRSGSLVAVVLRSASPKFFCAGANLKVMETINADTITPWVKRGHRVMNRIESLPVPVIAVVEGYAMGGGLELAMACDLILASSTARFGQSEAKLGLVTGWGGCYRLARRVGLSRAKELCFTGRMVEAGEAATLGLVDWCGTSTELESHLAGLVAAVGANSRAAVREMKAILATCATTTLEENAQIEADASRRCLTDGDAPARLEAFFAARKAPRPPA